MLTIPKDKTFKNVLENREMILKSGVKIYEPWLIMARVRYVNFVNVDNFVSSVFKLKSVGIKNWRSSIKIPDHKI